MKNQYFGDVNDFRKYGLLRSLIQSGVSRLGICWMLTEDDGRTDGQFTGYLKQPEPWRRRDPQLFDALRHSLAVKDSRSVHMAQSLGFLGPADFYDEVLGDDSRSRSDYFYRLREVISGCDLVFFDPDNGLEVRSVRKGRKKSSKYLYWDELRDAFQAGASVLVYQHFKREERQRFIARTAMEIRAETGCRRVTVIRTAHVAFFLMLHDKANIDLHRLGDLLQSQWVGQLWFHQIVDVESLMNDSVPPIGPILLDSPAKQES